VNVFWLFGVQQWMATRRVREFSVSLGVRYPWARQVRRARCRNWCWGRASPLGDQRPHKWQRTPPRGDPLSPSGSGAVPSRRLSRPKATWATPGRISLYLSTPASDWRMKVDRIARHLRGAWLLRVAEPWLRNSDRFGPFLESVPGPCPFLSASVEATFHAGQATAGATRAARRRLR
jgi:hypothetical protein